MSTEQEDPGAEAEEVQPVNLDDVMSQIGDEVFAKEDGEEAGEVVESTPADEAAAEEADDEPGTQLVEEDDGEAEEAAELSAPDFWDEDAQAAFDELDSEAQALVLRVNEASQAAFTQKTQELAEQSGNVAALSGLIDAWAPYLSGLGAQTPEAQAGAIGQVLQIEAVLRTGTDQQKQQAFESIRAEYKIPQPSNEGSDDDDDWGGGTTDKAAQEKIAALEAKVNQLTTALNQGQQTQVATQRAQIEKTVNDFKSATGDDGAPLRPHWDKLEKVIGAFLANKEAVPAGPLEDRLAKAYTMAVATDPKLTKPSAKATELANKREGKARKAAKANVKSTSASDAAAQAAQTGEKWDSDTALGRIYDAAIQE